MIATPDVLIRHGNRFSDMILRASHAR